VRSSRVDFLEIGDEPLPKSPPARATVSPCPIVPRCAEIEEIIGSYGSGVGEFNSLWGIAVDGVGALYVADMHNHRVQKITDDGDVYTIGGKGDEPGRFLFPSGVAVDGVGSIYVSDRSNSAIQRFDARGRFMLGIGRRGSAMSCLANPADVALDNFNNVWVVDTSNNRVQQFSATGRFLQCVDGGDRFCFNRPQGITIGSDFCVYVTDTLNRRIVQVLPGRHSVGKAITAEGSRTTLMEPCGIAADGNGNLYVTDAAANRVLCITNEGFPFVLVDGENGSPSRRLHRPRGIAVSHDGSSLYVADSLNHRVVRMGLH